MPTTWLDTVLRQTRRIGDFPYPHWASFLLDNPVRRLLANPADLAAALELSGTESVLELGPGSGFFSREVAGLLPHGRLELFDIQPEMLAKARHKLDRAGLRNVGFHDGDAGAALPFPDDTFDIAYSVSVIGEVPDKSSCLKSLRRVLKPGGLLVFMEGFPDPDRLSTDELRALAEPHGFRLRDTSGTVVRDIVRFDNT